MAKISWKRLSLTSVALIAVGAAVYVSATYWYGGATQRDLTASATEIESARDNAQKNGLWVNLEDVQTEQRAQGIEQYEEFGVFEDVLKQNPKLAKALDYSEERHLLTQEIIATPEAVDALFHIANLENVSFPIDWERGLLARAIDHTRVNRLVNFATSSAMAAREQQDDAEAWRRLGAGVKVMNYLKDEPVAESVLGWSSAAIKLFRAMYRIIESDPANASSVQSTFQLLYEIGEPLSFQDFLPGEALKYVVSSRNFDYYDYNDLKTLMMSASEEKLVPVGEDRPDAFETAALEFWTKAIGEVESIDNDVEKGIHLDAIGQAWAVDNRPSQFIGVAFASIYEQIGSQIARVKQMRRLLHSVCEVIEVWQKTGSFPDRLSDDTEWTIDPVAGAQFFYAATDNGFKIQAMGALSADQLRMPQGDLLWIQSQGYSLEFTIAE